MVITHVVPTLFGGEGLLGGGERYPFELCKALSALTPCRIVSFGAEGSSGNEDGVDFVVLKTRMQLKGHPAHPIARGLVRALAGSDVIHTHQMRSTPSRLGALIAKATRTPVVTTDHGLGGGGWAGLLPRLFDRFLTVSQSSAEALGAPPDKTRVVYGGVDVERFSPADGPRRGVLFVGRITPHKGIDVLLRGLPPDIKLTIVGTSGHDPGEPERSYPQLLRRLASDAVTFAGAVTDAELRELHRRAEVFVLPSVHRTIYNKHVRISELLGLSLLEAMASGTPVVASHIGGIPEIITHGETGFLVTPGDIGELGDRISALVSNRDLARKMGTSARRRVLSHFTWEHVARRCLAAYGELVPSLVKPPA